MKIIALVITFALWAVSAHAQQELDVSRIYLGSPAATMQSGSGAPEGVVSAPIGSTYYRTDTGRVYLKTSGAGTTGWTAISAVAPYVVGDLIVAGGTSGLNKLAAVSAGQVLASNGVGVVPVYTASPSLTSIGGAANLTLNPTGDLVLGPSGNDVLPSSGYTKNIGALTNKYLTLHAAELWVETLVAQDTIATIGGRVLVGPTTTLTADLSSVTTSIVVKHNQMAIGDRVYLEADGKVEFMAITSGPSGVGPYTYTVTRNLDGSGANDWFAGDAVFNTGTTGDGFIDLYSISAVNGPTVFGPTIVGNVRTGTTYSQFEPRWAIGNLNGVYDYGSDTYGAAFGDNANAWVKIDPTNGVRIGEGANTYVSVDPAGNALFAGNLTIGTGRNMLGNSEFRRESSTTGFGASVGAALATDGPRTGMRSIDNVLAVDGTKWLLGFYSGTGSPTWQWLCNIAPPVGSGNCYINVFGVAPSANSIKQFYGPSIAVAPDQTMEFSLYGLVDGHTVNIAASLNFYDASHNSLGQGTAVALQSLTNGGNTTLIGTYGRAYAIQTAPANTAYALPIVNVTYSATPSIPNNAVITRVYLGIAQAGQTQPTPWAPGGVTLIDGSMLNTDMVLTNTLRGGSATALATGTGFWLDATSTPTFRVGDPAGNQIKWDGTDILVEAGNLVIDGSSVRITPIDSGTAWQPDRGYTFDVPTGVLGMAGTDGSLGRGIFLRSDWNGSANRFASVGMDAISTNSGAGSQSANLTVAAQANGTSFIQMSAENLFLFFPTSPTAGAVANYLNVRVGLTNYKIPLHTP